MWVWRWYPPKAKQKLGLGWTGPFEVLEKVGESAVKIQRNGKSLVIHMNDVKPYEGRNQLADDSECECESVEESVEERSEMTQYEEERDEREATPVRTRVGREIRLPRRYSP